MIVAIVPAAGKSDRMGKPKLLLPLGKRRVIEHVLDALAQAPIDRSFVVLNSQAHELLDVLRQFEKVEAVPLDVPTRDMRASILAGVAHAQAATRATPPDACLVALADQPTISPNAVRCIIDRFQRDRPAIVVPTHSGKRGHPVLLAWTVIQQLWAIPPDRGLDHLISNSGPVVAECPLPNAAALGDLDTPDDYERFRRDWKDGG